MTVAAETYPASRELEQSIENVWSTSIAFVAQLRNGKVVAWGVGGCGGDISGVQGGWSRASKWSGVQVLLSLRS